MHIQRLCLQVFLLSSFCSARHRLAQAMPVHGSADCREAFLNAKASVFAQCPDLEVDLEIHDRYMT